MESKDLSGNTGRVLFCCIGKSVGLLRRFLSHNRDRRKETRLVENFKRGPPKGKKHPSTYFNLSRKGNKNHEK